MFVFGGGGVVELNGGMGMLVMGDDIYLFLYVYVCLCAFVFW